MKNQPATETELLVLQLLWRQGVLTSRQIACALYDDDSDPKLASAQKLLDRLQRKGCVQRDTGTRPYQFRAIVSKEDYVRQHVQRLADKLYDGSLSPVVTSLVNCKGISMRELTQIRRLIDQRSTAASRKQERKG